MTIDSLKKPRRNTGLFFATTYQTRLEKKEGEEDT